RHRLGDVTVGGVVAVLTRDEDVLTGPGRREEVDAEFAAHEPALGLDVVRLESAADEDLLVRLAVRLEAALDALVVAVERVRVLHDELADAEQPSAPARLVAVLDCDVLAGLRQLSVRLDRA